MRMSVDLLLVRHVGGCLMEMVLLLYHRIVCDILFSIFRLVSLADHGLLIHISFQGRAHGAIIRLDGIEAREVYVQIQIVCEILST